MRLKTFLWLSVSSSTLLSTVRAAFRAPSRLGSLGPYFDAIASTSSTRPASQVNCRSNRGGVALETLDIAGPTELKEALVEVEGQFRELLSLRHRIPTRNEDQEKLIKIKAEFERCQGVMLVERMQALSTLQTSQQRADASRFKLSVEALFLIAMSNKSKQKDILHFFLEASGPVFNTLPDLSKVEHLKKFVQNQINQIWREEIEQNSLKALIEPFEGSNSWPGFLENLRSGLLSTAQADWVWNDTFIVRLRILFSSGLMSIGEPQRLQDILKLLRSLSAIEGLSIEKRIATVQAFKALLQWSKN
ncbi:hypothetical protein PGT21_025876 [Puccinia graminis f. sp. tritici]|uniref:Secreted RxLR effector peptide protein n=1 Tax=Puccinia graminis f. sp. tritici TaxID=56615 RepID=A0A5B0NB36_PUCGR|nr:hypothetical protein PGT21_025876 [Puccinia graminis f. sp. tritici]